MDNKSNPNFDKGGKFGFLHSTNEAFRSFLKVPDTVATRGSHVRDCNDLKRIMIVVVLALVPAALFGIYNIGYQHNLSIGGDMSFWQLVWYGFLKILPLYLVSYIVGLAIEFTFAQVRGHEVNEGYLVTGMIIPLIMPVDVPLWMLAIAVAFAVIFGKEVFGGTGMNIWNPALIARAFLFFAYPSHMTGDKVWISGLSGGEGVLDGFSGATPLAEAPLGKISYSVSDMFLGLIPGSVGETSIIAIAIGAIILLWCGVASWKIMISCIAGALAMGYLANLLSPSPDSYMALPAWKHLIMGGFAFGAVFMATDPVTSAQTEGGKWIYGFLIGVMTIIIRLFNPGYPEGMMLSILLMNTAAPLIDHWMVNCNIRRRMRRSLKSNIQTKRYEY